MPVRVSPDWSVQQSSLALCTMVLQMLIVCQCIDYISGVILFSETLHDFALAPLITKRGIIPGVRADIDSHPLPISPFEPSTQGLDDLFPRLKAAYTDGARFSKWRAPILCDAAKYPTHAALEAQADALARFAAISQMAGLVPIVEPDVDFSADATLGRSVEVHVRIISMIYAKCAQYGVLLEGATVLRRCGFEVSWLMVAQDR